MINIILFDILFLDVYPALANAIITFTMLLVILFFNKELIIDAIKRLTSFQAKSKVPINKRLITFGITILIIILIFTIDSFIENWLGASKEKIIG